MASTNEDAVALATSRFEGRVLVLRHLPDRGTIELGWWRDEAGAILQAPPVLEIAAEAAEVEAFVALCQEAAAKWEGAGGGGEIAATGEVAEGARIVALRAGDEVMLARRPDPDSQVSLPRAALDELNGAMLPEGLRKLEKLGFGLPQQRAAALTR